MKDNGIDFGAFRAGDIQGTVCRKLMGCGGGDYKEYDRVPTEYSFRKENLHPEQLTNLLVAVNFLS